MRVRYTVRNTAPVCDAAAGAAAGAVSPELTIAVGVAKEAIQSVELKDEVAAPKRPKPNWMFARCASRAISASAGESKSDADQVNDRRASRHQLVRRSPSGASTCSTTPARCSIRR